MPACLPFGPFTAHLALPVRVTTYEMLFFDNYKFFLEHYSGYSDYSALKITLHFLIDYPKVEEKKVQIRPEVQSQTSLQANAYENILELMKEWVRQ